MKRVLDMSDEFSVCLGKLAVCFQCRFTFSGFQNQRSPDLDPTTCEADPLCVRKYCQPVKNIFIPC